MKRTIFFLFISLSGSLLAARDNYPRNPNVDALHYRISINIDDSMDFITGTAEILFGIKTSGVADIPLDFVGLSVLEALENNSSTIFRRNGDRLIVVLRNRYRTGDSCRITIRYSGRPADGLFIQNNKFGDRAVFADNWPNRARYWFPSVDHPYDKATVEFLITAPARYDVVANGMLKETTVKPGGVKLTHWSETVPIPTYCMVIGATEFSVLHMGDWNGIPLSYWVYPKDRDNSIKDYGRALKMMEFYSTLIGPYPYEKLALVQSSTRFGGMENSSAIFFAEQAFNGSGGLEGTTAHEIAHQWFGDAVTEADWHHLWLSEGFASYFGPLFFEFTDGKERMKQSMREAKEGYLLAMKDNPHAIHDTTITDLFKLLNAYNYQKGALVLHMLRKELGDEQFFAGIREYYQTYKNGTALTEDLRRIMEKHAVRTLGWFFQQWIFSAGHPVFEAMWKWNPTAKTVELRLRQKQQTVFQMPLEVEFNVGGSLRRETIRVNEKSQSFTFAFDTKPALLSIDPDEWMLKELTLTEEE